ncbi:MAG: preprotein translocase subunit SecG [Bacteroidales bacterium]|uniref:preprotein translocase subunit SecG n=1 Tax=Porphyromonas sp. TaxID=1924944 RepID=UPI0029737153|nr:preprotein translocase subunit SecG [Porphyromonas sp.]MDD7437681.1 preprotein translocase subunit SecG [Bacteroidales bacterium]MDY3067628.1 preprotein translocase subunit SecG [Porphyromonas sp.]
MYVFLSILIVLLAIVLVFVVTIQNSKGGGLAAGFASSNNVMGVRRTTDLIEKITWGLAIAIGVLAILTAKWAPHNVSNQPESVIMDKVNEMQLPTPADAQPFGEVEAPVTEAPAETTTPVETTPTE